MESNLDFRLASLKDIPALEQVGARLFDYELKRSRMEELLKDPRHHLVLAITENQIVGMASGVHYIHPDKEPQLFINEVSVLEDFQNRRIGRRLVKFLNAHGKTLGCVEAWVGVDIDNTIARKAYAAAGGLEEGPFIMVNFKWCSAGLSADLKK